MRNKLQTQIELQRKLQKLSTHTLDKEQSKLHHQLARIIAKYRKE